MLQIAHQQKQHLWCNLRCSYWLVQLLLSLHLPSIKGAAKECGIENRLKKKRKIERNGVCLSVQIIAQSRECGRESLSTAVSPLSPYDRRTSREEKRGFRRPRSAAQPLCSAVSRWSQWKEQRMSTSTGLFHISSHFPSHNGFKLQEIKGSKRERDRQGWGQHNLCTN